MTNPVAEYAAACRARDEALRKIHATADLLAAVARALTLDPLTIYIRSSPPLRDTKVVPVDQPLLVPSAAWPSVNNLQILLRMYRHATYNVHQRWALIPEEQRRFIKPP
jgi:hypothetical protein